MMKFDYRFIEILLSTLISFVRAQVPTQPIVVGVRVTEIYRCTGTILTRRTVLTTAKCVSRDEVEGDLYDASAVDVIAGAETLPLTMDVYFLEVILASDLAVIGPEGGTCGEHSLAIIALESGIRGYKMHLPGKTGLIIDDPDVCDFSDMVVKGAECEIHGWGQKGGGLYKIRTWLANVERSESCYDRKDKDLVCLTARDSQGMSEKTQGAAVYCNYALVGVMECDKNSCTEPRHPQIVRLVHFMPGISRYLNILELRGYSGSYPVSGSNRKVQDVACVIVVVNILMWLIYK